MSPEHYGTEPTLQLPSNIHDLLDVSLVPVITNPIRTNTEKFLIEGHPDLFVRLNRGNSLEDTKATLDSARVLNEGGIDVVPAQLVEHRGESYVVVKKVEGVPLTEALAHNPSEELITATDQIWTTMINVLSASKDAGVFITSDISTPEQYMFGTISGDDIPKVWLTDISEYTLDLNYHDTYVDELLNIAGGIIEIEALTGRRLNNARMALEEAIAASDDSVVWGDGIRNATQVVLDTGATISSWDDEILANLSIR